MTPAARTSLALGSGPEFDLIREINQLLGPKESGLGDDCAIIPAGDAFFALSTDVSVEQVHFRLDWVKLADAGWRATAAALSDLAADGAQPVGVLIAVTMPSAAPRSDLLQVMTGARDAAGSVGASIIGGDLSSGPVWTVALTVIGHTRAPISRKGAEPGDGVWVTGVLGGSRAALEAWRGDRRPQPGARARYARPEPRIEAGRWLAENGARAMIDLSDGLAGDASHLAAASGVAMEIDLSRLPMAPEVEAEATTAGVSPQQFAAEGGEDFELLVSLPAGFDATTVFTRATDLPLTRIGTVVSGQGVRFLHHGRALTLKSFDHFG